MTGWKEAAYDNPILAAAELYYMARPEQKRVRWRKLLASSQSGDGLSLSAASPVAPGGWGRRKRRSSMVFVSDKTADKEEEVKAPGGRSSPTTPLSWNACELPDSPPEKKKRAAAGSVVKGGRGGGGGGGRGGGGSVKTAAELKELERALLEKNVQLKKELEEQKLAKSLLVEENNRLQSLKAKVQQNPGAVATTSKHDEEHQPFPFDLNLPCSIDPDDGADHDQAGGCS